MPAKDLYHQVVREALEKEGWIITHDPYFVQMGKRKGVIDLGAEIIAASKDTQTIVVEIKTFGSLSEVDDFAEALGQYMLYKFALTKKEPERMLFMALPEEFYNDFFDDAFFVEIANLYGIKMIIFNPKTKHITT